ncbi:Endosulfine-domain-containing protein [Westerdykella ornata]|uniref:mRNA stability protein n=1 Tax=Westerdykella ornata TaxID=318751 RepID=A0A6A6J6R9_WESOR|nr:Endosulfine-domain-containing protein [Westerdykella ornata]KAF2271326.1 Endosulfine-domain-containing protein [Westerdykella ornata]
MNPHQQNKVDLSKLNPEEQRLFRLYGKLPNKKDLIQNKLKERKYFDSGDYALSKAGKASDLGLTEIGREHPVPEKIPHIAPLASPHGSNTHNGQNKDQASASPVKEHAFLHRESSLHREASADDFEDEQQPQQQENTTTTKS